MNDLPTREEAQQRFEFCSAEGSGNWTPFLVEERLLAARANGALMTRDEWIDTIDYEAAARTKQQRSHANNDELDPYAGYYPPWDEVPAGQQQRMIERAKEEVDAALGIGGDE